MAGFINIRDPRTESAVHSTKTLPTLDQLAGKTMVVLNNGWTSMDRIVARLQHGLRTRHGIGEVVSFAIPVAVAADVAVIDAASKRADFAIVGLAN